VWREKLLALCSGFIALKVQNKKPKTLGCKVRLVKHKLRLVSIR